MFDTSTSESVSTYRNPVYGRSFPDPYVLKFCGEYFAFCTGHWTDGRVFGVLRSNDLVNWTEAGGAMEPLAGDDPYYWAPEVTYHNGKFYLYYSVGNEVLMHLRVAVSSRPDGGYVDSGVRLTTEDFAIDAHVFTDDDGRRYMFYATDFLEHSHIGTGTVVDEMVDWFTLAGKPRPVTRAKYDWQVYDPHRIEKGGVRWHTVEGPFILKRKGLYYEMFSGGNWQNTTYGVSFALSDRIMRDDEWEQVADGESVLPVLRTIPDRIIGPGHNSVVRGPDNRELYCIYHNWTEHGRVLSIDRMDFAGERLFVHGPTDDDQPAPFKPLVAAPADGDEMRRAWTSLGDWRSNEGELVCESADECTLEVGRDLDGFLLEVSARADLLGREDACLGIRVKTDSGATADFMIFPKQCEVSAYSALGGNASVRSYLLDKEFRPEAFHLMCAEFSAGSLRFRLDDGSVVHEARLAGNSARVSLAARNCTAAFMGIAITEGFEDLFKHAGNAADLGYHISGDGRCVIENGEMSIETSGEVMVEKGAFHAQYAFAANLRVAGKVGEFGFAVFDEDSREIERFTIVPGGSCYLLRLSGDSGEYELSSALGQAAYHQFGIMTAGGKFHFSFDGERIAASSASSERSRVAIFCKNSFISADMVRLTVI